MDAFCGGSGGLGGGGDLDPLASNVVNPNGMSQPPIRFMFFSWVRGWIAKRSLVVAIVLFGDPSHVANTTYDKGTSKNDGVRNPFPPPP